MILSVKQLNRFGLIVCAPFLGIFFWLAAANLSITLPDDVFPQVSAASEITLAASDTDKLKSSLDQAKQTAMSTAQSIKKSVALYNQTNANMSQIAQAAAAQSGRPAMIYDRRITRQLGFASETVQSDNLTAQLFRIKAQNFTGYALKVKLKSPTAMQMVLGKDEFGQSETTLAAVKRYHAVAGVNAGGFADSGRKRYPLSTTVVDGKYVNGFEPTFKDLFFVGMNEDMKLIGGNYRSQSQLDAQKPKFGASFVPVLMKNRIPQPIPAKWQVSPKRAPRTVIANYKDNQLLFLVTDGYNENGNSGATLQEMQILLTRYGAIDGYNLDGGGSSSLIFNGRVVNKPSDGVLRSLPTHFLFFK